MIDLRPGDNREQLRRMARNGEFVHSVVCDPPYGLVSVTKRFGGKNAAPAKHGTDGLFARQSRGFMGKLWDGSGIERDPEFWRLVYDVMLPGAYIIAFSSSRTYGYMQVAMEAAGFITHPMFGWVFGSGFPKGHDPKVEGFDGWKTGTQSLKPALEPIYFGQKPFSEKTGALSILKHGVGAVNIDACRVPFVDAADEQEAKTKNQHGDFDSGPMTNQVYGKYTKDRENYNPPGRYPANLVHDGSPEVVALFPNSGGGHHPSKRGKGGIGNDGHKGQEDLVERFDSQSGSAARFFNSFPPIVYCPKAGKTDRAGSKHATVKPVTLMEHYVKLTTPPGGVVLDPFAGSGTTGQACVNLGFDCILMEREHEYVMDIARRFNVDPGLAARLWALAQ